MVLARRQTFEAMVLIASASAGVCGRWRQGLEGIFAIHEVADQAALETSMATLKPAVLLLDLALPGLRGVSGVPAIQELSPSTKIVLLTRTPDEREGISALKAGASGYWRTDIEPALLQKAVELVQQGEIWVGRHLISYVLEELSSVTARRQKRAPGVSDSRLERLTPREREVATLIAEGASNREIASRLNIAEKTVKAHLTAIFRKLGLSDRLQLALFMIKRTRRSR